MIDHLPSDWRDAVLLGRLLREPGPTPVLVVGGRVRDISRVAPTVSQFLNGWRGGELPAGQDLGRLEDLHLVRAFDGGKGPRLLSPFDLQCIKAAGVTFAVSAIERVIEERARGDAGARREPACRPAGPRRRRHPRREAGFARPRRN